MLQLFDPSTLRQTNMRTIPESPTETRASVAPPRMIYGDLSINVDNRNEYMSSTRRDAEFWKTLGSKWFSLAPVLLKLGPVLSLLRGLQLKGAECIARLNRWCDYH